MSSKRKNVIPYSAFVCPILGTMLALFRDTERKRKPGRALVGRVRRESSPARVVDREFGSLPNRGGLPKDGSEYMSEVPKSRFLICCMDLNL